MKIRTVLLLVSSVIGLCRGFPSGAPSSACGSMLPRHGYRTRPQDHSKNPSPYTITIEENYDTYTPGQKFELTVHSTSPLHLMKGFILEARTISGEPVEPVGTFNETHKGTKAICQNKALTHYRVWRVKGDKFHVTWFAPQSDVGEIAFVATVVKSYNIYWSNVRSIVIKAHRPPTTTPTPTTTAATTTTTTTTTTTATPATASMEATSNKICDDALLMSLPVERPFVAILCDAHAQCPCGWLCCPSCLNEECAGHAICRQPIQGSMPEPISAVHSEKAREPTKTAQSASNEEYAFARDMFS